MAERSSAAEARGWPAIQLQRADTPAEKATEACMNQYRSFREFWPFYLREHSRPATRALHYAGTSLVLAIATVALVTSLPVNE